MPAGQRVEARVGAAVEVATSPKATEVPCEAVAATEADGQGSGPVTSHTKEHW